MNKEEQGYLSLLQEILQFGENRSDRTGTGTKSMFGKRLEFNLENNILPVITTKKVPIKSIIKELLWFLSGSTDANVLKAQGVNIWNGNSSREFLDKRGLYDLPEGDIGAGYGHQWRHFGAEYVNCHTDYSGKGFDQINYVLNLLKNDPYSRRIILNAWNPQHMHKMSLPCCHQQIQFYVDDKDRIHGQMYQRSADLFLGVPWNITSYSLLIYFLAHLSGRKPGGLIIIFGDAHIYQNHIQQVNQQIQRKPYPFPKISFKNSNEIKKIEDFNVDNIIIENYVCHPKISADMAI